MVTRGRGPISYQQLVAAARQRIREIDPEYLEARLGDVEIVDVREAPELQEGVIAGARSIPLGTLLERIGAAVPDRDREIVLYCTVGARSALAAAALTDAGYRNATSLGGGLEQWKREGRPLAPAQAAAPDPQLRYSRHLALAEVGEEGQAKLGTARVAVIGAGGLGSSTALYLAAAGVGRLSLIDYDTVDLSNLQRQVLHTTGRLGWPKVESGLETLTALNPEIEIRPLAIQLNAANALALLAGHDVIVDGSDNFPTRYLVNDASLHLGIPVVHGSILRFEGRAGVFSPYDGPCYRCLFPAPPPPELTPSCAEAGVVGALAGVIGSIQAMEAIKLIVGIGRPLVGRFLIYDALQQRFGEHDLARDPECPACADPALPPRLVDYDRSCAPAGSVGRGAG